MKRAIDYIQIGVGTLVAALSVNLFMIPNQLASGGLGGLLLLLHYLWSIPIGTTYLAVNLPIFAWLYRLHGWHGLMKTVWGTASFSLFLELTRPLAGYAPTQNLLLASIYAGVLMGLGLGLAIRVGGSTGGTSAIGHVVRHYTGFDLSRFLLLTDLLIFAVGAFVLSMEAILYAAITTFLVMKLIQTVLEGFSTSRCLLIISEKPDAVSQSILRELQRGVTRLSGKGEYSGQPRPVLLCVVGETEVLRIKRLVLAADPNAFLVVTDAREVEGQGFTLDTDVRKIPFWAAQRGA